MIGKLVDEDKDHYMINKPLKIKLMYDELAGQQGLQYEKYSHFIQSEDIRFDKNIVRHTFTEDELVRGIVQCYDQMMEELGDDTIDDLLIPQEESEEEDEPMEIEGTIH